MLVYYTYLALSGARATSGIWILYLLGRGLPLWEIGLLESAFHVTVLLGEVPTGYFADRVGHRWSLALGALCGVGGNLLFLAATAPVAFLAAFVLSALSWVLPSGADRAVLYGMTSDAAEYPRRAAKAGAVRSLASAAGLLLGGAAAAVGGLGLAYDVEAGVLGLALIVALLLPAVPRTRDAADEAVVAWRDVLHAARALLRPIASGSLVFAAMNLASLLLQPLLAARGAAASLVAWSRGASELMLALGSLLAGRLPGSLTRRRFVQGLPAALAALYALLGRSPLWPAICLQQLESAAGGAYEAALDAEQMPLFPPRLRATLFSLQSALQSAMVAILFPVFGWALGSAHYGGVFLAIAALAAAGALLWHRSGRRRGGALPLLAAELAGTE